MGADGSTLRRYVHITDWHRRGRPLSECGLGMAGGQRWEVWKDARGKKEYLLRSSTKSGFMLPATFFLGIWPLKLGKRSRSLASSSKNWRYLIGGDAW